MQPRRREPWQREQQPQKQPTGLSEFSFSLKGGSRQPEVAAEMPDTGVWSQCNSRDKLHQYKTAVALLLLAIHATVTTRATTMAERRRRLSRRQQHRQQQN